MKLKIAYYGNPILRKKCEPILEITDEIRSLANAMLLMLEEVNGIGLAAPQVHFPLRLFVTCVPLSEDEETYIPGTPRVFINPTILSYSDSLISDGEGCVSIPNVYGDVDRPSEITVQATNLDGSSFQESFSGYEARCILHENDHINGKLFIDRLNKKQRDKIEPLLRKIKW